MLKHDAVFYSLLFLNLPFRFYRNTAERFSRAWGRCIYIPILLGIVLRRLAGAGHWLIPIGICAVLAGQAIGAYLNKKMSVDCAKC